MHIFSTGPMCSLRRTLLMWLVPMFILVGGASAAFSYWNFGRMADSFMDEKMQQLGDAIAAAEEPMSLPVQSAEQVHKSGGYVTQVFGADGRLQATSWRELTVPLAGRSGFHDIEAAGSTWRAYTAAAKPGSSRVQVLQSAEFRRHVAAGRAGEALAPTMIMLALTLLVLWGVAGAVSREVGAIGRNAAEQDEHSADELPLQRVPAELRPLVASFNALLTRLREECAMQRRFLQDAAHELRSPITAVALQLENVRRDLPADACAQTFAQLEAGVGRARRVVDQMLKMSRHEAAVQDPPVLLDIQAQLHESINVLIALADQRSIDLGLVVAPGTPAGLSIRCAASDLRSVLDNLIENALRYTPEGGVVDVRIAAEEGRPVIEVVDSGPGIPAEAIGRVFDRFFRLPGTGTVGSGLGLAIAKTAAQRCGLSIVLANREGGGLVARVASAGQSVAAATSTESASSFAANKALRAG
jgi:two-component system, OmpR family, sensor kinase